MTEIGGLVRDQRVTYISLEEESALALEGARKRLELARQAIAEFHAVHGDAPAELFMREYHGLRIELDSAARHYEKSLEDWNELRGAEPAVVSR